MDEVSWNDGISSISRKFRAGSEKWLLVELPFLISFIVSNATIVFLKIPSPAIVPVISSAITIVGKSSSIVVSHCLTSFEMISVVKKGCSKTFWMNEKCKIPPVRLSYFFKIFVIPTYIKISRILQLVSFFYIISFSFLLRMGSKIFLDNNMVKHDFFLFWFTCVIDVAIVD